MRRTLPVLVLLAALVAAVAVLTASDPGIDQPIAYNHHLHVEGEGLVCTDCHVGVEERARATLPSLSICMDCHDVDPLTDSPEEETLIGYIESGREVPWNRVYTVPDHVYFSHRRHVVLGELDCFTCHGTVAEFEQPITRPRQEITMDWCITCHAGRGVTNDCIACHR